MRQNQSSHESIREAKGSSNSQRGLPCTSFSILTGAYLLVLILMMALVGGQLTQFGQCQEQLNVESRQQKDNEDLSNTIKYLESMDKYLSQMSRPRFGRSEGSSRQQLGRAQESLLTLQAPNSGALYQLSPLADLLRARLARKYTDAL